MGGLRPSVSARTVGSYSAPVSRRRFAEDCYARRVVWQLFSHMIRPRPAIAEVGTGLISGVGSVLVLLPCWPRPTRRWTTRTSWTFARTPARAEPLHNRSAGWLLFFFCCSTFRLTWRPRLIRSRPRLRRMFCEHLATCSVMATGALPDNRYYLLDFFNMATYHICVLIWFYYLLVPAEECHDVCGFVAGE